MKQLLMVGILSGILAGLLSGWVLRTITTQQTDGAHFLTAAKQVERELKRVTQALENTPCQQQCVCDNDDAKWNAVLEKLAALQQPEKGRPEASAHVDGPVLQQYLEDAPIDVASLKILRQNLVQQVSKAMESLARKHGITPEQIQQATHVTLSASEAKAKAYQEAIEGLERGLPLDAEALNDTIDSIDNDLQTALRTTLGDEMGLVAAEKLKAVVRPPKYMKRVLKHILTPNP